MTKLVLNTLRAQQLGDGVYESLLESIVSGRVEPGTHLPIEALARQLGVSTTPVRDALGQLVRDGLVIKKPYHGYSVRTYSPKEIKDIYETRAALEAWAIRLCCERITDSGIDELHKLQAIGSEFVKVGDVDAYGKYNRDFHAAIFRAADNNVLQMTLKTISFQVDMMATWTVNVTGRPERGWNEHERLVKLVEARNAAKASEAMERHILDALETVINNLLPRT